MLESIVVISILFASFSSPLFIAFFLKVYLFRKSSYSKETRHSMYKTLNDKGLKGEYLTVKSLDRINGYHKILVNVYVPNRNQGTTEIDIIFIHKKGVSVLESKNFSGIIYGEELEREWSQQFRNGYKQSFYNPIMQNEGHLKALKRLLPNIPEEAFTSMIVFSDHCELKNIKVKSADVFVLNRNQLRGKLKKILRKSSYSFKRNEIDSLYESLKPYCNVSEHVKTAHIEKIKAKMAS